MLELLWDYGESSVHDVAERLTRPLAYTTVMTTLDRLFKKGLLERRKVEPVVSVCAALDASGMGAKTHGRFRGWFPGFAAGFRRGIGVVVGGCGPGRIRFGAAR